MRKVLAFMIFYVLPRPLARGVVAVAIFAGMFLKKTLVGPRNVQISVPAGCDHDCVFCITDIHGEGASHLRNVLSFEDLCELIDSALSLCSLNIHFVSNGEPLLYSKIQELIDYTWRKSRGRAEIKIVTNGTSLKNKFSPQDFKKKNVVLWLSLHSGNFEQWKSIHRPLHSAEEKFNGLKYWLRDFQSLAQGAVTIHVVLNKLNAFDLSHLLDFCLETHSKKVSFGDLFRFDHLALSEGDKEVMYHELRKLLESFKAHGIKNNISSFLKLRTSMTKNSVKYETSGDDGEVLLLQENFYDQHECYISWIFSPIDDSGNVRTCGAGYFLGSIRDKKYDAIILDGFSYFYGQSTQITSLKTVEGCFCVECPHKEMNGIANRYLNIFKIKIDKNF